MGMKVKREVETGINSNCCCCYIDLGELIFESEKHCSTGIMCFMVFMTGWMD